MFKEFGFCCPVSLILEFSVCVGVFAWLFRQSKIAVMVWWSSKRHLSTIDCFRRFCNHGLYYLVIDWTTNQLNMHIRWLIDLLLIRASRAHYWRSFRAKNFCELLKVPLPFLRILILYLLFKSFSALNMARTCRLLVHSYLSFWLLKLREYICRLVL